MTYSSAGPVRERRIALLAMLEVGVGDAVRFYHTVGGARNIAELGSLEDSAGVRSLLNVSALHRVRDGVLYTAGTNESLVIGSVLGNSNVDTEGGKPHFAHAMERKIAVS